VPRFRLSRKPVEPARPAMNSPIERSRPRRSAPANRAWDMRTTLSPAGAHREPSRDLRRGRKRVPRTSCGPPAHSPAIADPAPARARAVHRGRQGAASPRCMNCRSCWRSSDASDDRRSMHPPGRARRVRRRRCGRACAACHMSDRSISIRARGELPQHSGHPAGSSRRFEMAWRANQPQHLPPARGQGRTAAGTLRPGAASTSRPTCDRLRLAPARGARRPPARSSSPASFFRLDHSARSCPLS